MSAITGAPDELAFGSLGWDVGDRRASRAPPPSLGIPPHSRSPHNGVGFSAFGVPRLDVPISRCPDPSTPPPYTPSRIPKDLRDSTPGYPHFNPGDLKSSRRPIRGHPR